jgi:two-component system sensor histidine kinase GlrK
LPQIIAAAGVYYPRSFLKFILLGFLLVSAPLIYALGELILSLDRLQAQGREAVQQAAQAARASRQLFEHATTLERIVRQHLILDDIALLDDYARVQQEFRQSVAQLGALPLAPEQLAGLDALAARETRLHRSLVAPQRAAEVQAQLADGYAKLADGAQAMLAVANQLTERATERLQEIADQAARNGSISRSRRRASRSRSRSCSRC